MVDIFCGNAVIVFGRLATACDDIGDEAGGADGEAVAGADV